MESFFTFLGPNELFLGSMWGSKTVLGSAHVVEQLLFYVSLNLDIWLWLNFRMIFTFWGPIGLFLGLGVLKNMILGSTHHDWQLCFSMYWFCDLSLWIFPINVFGIYYSSISSDELPVCHQTLDETDKVCMRSTMKADRWEVWTSCWIK